MLGNSEVPSNVALGQNHLADCKSEKSHKRKICYSTLTLNSQTFFFLISRHTATPVDSCRSSFSLEQMFITEQ